MGRQHSDTEGSQLGTVDKKTALGRRDSDKKAALGRRVAQLGLKGAGCMTSQAVRFSACGRHLASGPRQALIRIPRGP